jgi:N-acetylglutamate synthase-like GNAT family acetyltransferase
MLSPKIRPCTQKDIGVLAETIRRSFQDVALRFELTLDNVPRHPSNCTEYWIQKDMKRGVTYYALENENLVAGCVAIEKADSNGCYLERLAVLPDKRRHGFGKALVTYVLSEARNFRAKRVNIGIIADQTELKNWYTGIGFVEGESKEFAHLPFRVTFMSYKLDKEWQQ